MPTKVTNRGSRCDLAVDRPQHMTNRPALLFAFTFAVMADPVSSVAYAIEAALRALRGDLALLLPTMTSSSPSSSS